MYLFKYVSKSGITSRRKTSDLIKNGQISVNGKITKDLYHEVLKDDVVVYKNNVLELPALVYILLNKPKDYLCTLNDPRGRKNVLELVQDKSFGRIYPVGRLDRMTTGLILLTNDGDLTQKLSHPKYNVPKGYRVLLDKVFINKDFNKLLNGLKLEDGFISVDKLSYIPNKKRDNLELFIHSGRNRIVRRIFEHLGYKVKKLDRFNYAGLSKKGLDVGRWRRLSKKEISDLKRL